MAAQLITMYLHIYVGLTKKEKEIWLIESHKKSTGSVRKTEKIKIVMNIEKIRKKGTSILAICNFNTIEDKTIYSKIKEILEKEGVVVLRGMKLDQLSFESLTNLLL